MDGSEPTEADAWPQAPGRLNWTGREAWADAVARLVDGLEAARVTRLCWITQDPLSWPWEQAELLERLARWARPAGRQWLWLGTDFEPVRHGAPRLMRWRATWDHRVQCLAVEEARLLEGRECLLAQGLGLIERVPGPQVQGRICTDPRELVLNARWIDAVSQRATVTFPVTTIGI
ncbi:hypothetical protein [Ideonella alba]|uniref:Uncharacterized protein n=1 Tax=Ideonella alba TaxID=2824118 RepID=A0A941BHR2_9BURK|nr:hypothetical protein [Ideonella alba]MBQ0931908.1 hypothetical protein [Ideonella alba]